MIFCKAVSNAFVSSGRPAEILMQFSKPGLAKWRTEHALLLQGQLEVTHLATQNLAKDKIRTAYGHWLQKAKAFQLDVERSRSWMSLVTLSIKVSPSASDASAAWAPATLTLYGGLIFHSCSMMAGGRCRTPPEARRDRPIC